MACAGIDPNIRQALLQLAGDIELNPGPVEGRDGNSYTLNTGPITRQTTLMQSGSGAVGINLVGLQYHIVSVRYLMS